MKQWSADLPGKGRSALFQLYDASFGVGTIGLGGNGFHETRIDFLRNRFIMVCKMMI